MSPGTVSAASILSFIYIICKARMDLWCLSAIRMVDTHTHTHTHHYWQHNFCRYQVYVIGDVTEWLKEESEVRRSFYK